LTILYDNIRFDPRLKTAWGFSCLVRGLEKTILFDTGGDGFTLLENMRRLRGEPSEIDIVVLSHIHGDHTGGLERFKSLGARFEEVLEARELFPGAYTTGELGDGIREQALALKTTEGLVVITGCAHPGIVNMVRKAKEMTGQDTVYLLVGGFHLGGEQPSRIKSVAKELRLLSVQKVVPCHCSGDETRRLFREKFGADYVEGGVGKGIELPDLE
jgi:7,8-dihydropterin-6-yl-methyl-4-(beta-D-ribofuranosyl)aminobenzene 5'-phosphate synthase